MLSGVESDVVSGDESTWWTSSGRHRSTLRRGVRAPLVIAFAFWLVMMSWGTASLARAGTDVLPPDHVVAQGSSGPTELAFTRPHRAVRELTHRRTAVSRTWELASGKRITQIAATPQQWRDRDGSWHAIDLTLRRIERGWTAKGGSFAVTLPARLTSTQDGAVRVSDRAGHWLAMRPLVESASASAAGDAVTYHDVGPAVDLRLQPVAEGLKEDLILRGPRAQRDVAYELVLSSAKLELRRDKRGDIVIGDGRRVAFRIPAPTMVDQRGLFSGAARYVVRQVGTRTWRLAIELDDRWLDAPHRAWPVVVDPTVLNPTLFSAPATMCQLELRYQPTGPSVPTMSCGSGGADLKIEAGFDGAPYGRYTLLRFSPLTLVQTDRIDRATLKLTRTDTTPEAVVHVHRMTTSWSPSTAWTSNAQVTNGFDAARELAFQPSTFSTASMTVDLTNLAMQWRRHEDTGGTSGLPNYGVLLKQEGNYFYCFPTCSKRTSVSRNPADAPVLEVASWPAAPAGSAIITPGEGELSARRVRLQAKALHSSVTTARFQYIAGTQRSWTDVPAAALSTPSRAAIADVDIPVSGPSGDRRSDLVVWDLSKMPGGDVDGPVHVRAWLESPTAGQGGMTDEVNFRVDRRGIADGASADIGPGTVDLLSGEFTTTAVDASFESALQDVTLTRTYESRGVPRRDADMFGPGWEASVEADGGDVPYKGLYNYSEVKDVAVDRQVLNPDTWNWELFFESFTIEDLQPEIETVQEVERWEYRYAVIEGSDGKKMTFTQTLDPGGQVTGWEPDDEHPGFDLTRDSTATTGIYNFTLKDPSGNVAKFTSEAANSPNYRLVTFAKPGTTTTLAYTYEAAGTRQRLKTVTAPLIAPQYPRKLVFNWANVGNPVRSRVTSVQFQQGFGTPVTMAEYQYDDQARLIRVSDPRAPGGRPTQYRYDAGSRLERITPSGESPWDLTYQQVAGDAGWRLATVSRAHPNGSTATQTIRYDVPLSGAGAPYDMSPTETARWGQTDDLPWDAVAIFPGDDVPTAGQPDYAKAAIHYVGMHGKTVNVARPGGAIATMEHDANGNVIRELTAENRARALAAGSNSASAAHDNSTLYQYSGSGADLVALRGPEDDRIKLSSGSVVSGRRVRTTHYDENAPAGGPYHLPTSEWRAVETAPGVYVDERELVRRDYDGYGGMSGWVARHATKTIQDPGGKALTSYSILHPTYPVVEETRTPGGAGGGSSPDVQWHEYYGIGPSARVPSNISNSGMLCTVGSSGGFYGAGRLCLRQQATTPTADVPRRWYWYSMYGHVSAVYDSKTTVGSNARGTTRSYNGADELTSVAVSGGAGTAVPAITYSYDPTTGRQTSAASSAGTITRAYDSNGRIASYTDASGVTSTSRYDLRGRLGELTENGGRDTFFGYDERDNRTSVTDPAMDRPITATYDLDDRLISETLPSDLRMTESYDESGLARIAQWEKTTGCSSNCTWVDNEVSSRDADTNITGGTIGGRAKSFSYDSAARLARSDIRDSQDRCLRTTYTYDSGAAGDSNRTEADMWTSAPTDSCGTGVHESRATSYDSADRVTSWTWDGFDRATSVPSPDSGGGSALTSTYFMDNYVRTLTLDGQTNTYTWDPARRLTTVDATGASTSTYHYSDDSDRPTSVSRAGGVVQREIRGPSGNLVAVADGSEVTYQLRDIEGSIVATSTGGSAPTRRSEYDPFGLVTTPASTNVIDWSGLQAYGWLGGHQRPTAFGQTVSGSSGPVVLGARVYLPRAGRFLQPDPIDGASANAYDYVDQNPANVQDLDGASPAIDPCTSSLSKRGTGIGRNPCKGKYRGRVAPKVKPMGTAEKIVINCGLGVGTAALLARVPILGPRILGRLGVSAAVFNCVANIVGFPPRVE